MCLARPRNRNGLRMTITGGADGRVGAEDGGELEKVVQMALRG